jgi:hypothetical protein
MSQKEVACMMVNHWLNREIYYLRKALAEIKPHEKIINKDLISMADLMNREGKKVIEQHDSASKTS